MSPSRVNARPKVENKEAGEVLPPGENLGEDFEIRGFIKHEEGKPISDLFVRVLMVSLKESKPIPKATVVNTDKQGIYRIRFPHQKDSIDVRIEVAKDKKFSDIVARSSVKYNIKQTIQIDIEIGNKDVRLPSLFSKLGSSISTSLLEGVSLVDIDTKKAIVIAGKIDQSLSLVANYIASKKLSIRSKNRLSHEQLFGLLCEGLPPRLDLILSTPLEVLVKALAESGSKNVISEQIANNETLLTNRYKLAQKEIAKDPDVLHSFEKQIDVLTLTENKKSRLIQKYRNRNKENPKAFWESLRKDSQFSNNDVKKIQLAVELAAITISNPELSDKLINGKKIKSVKEVLSYRLTDWKNYIQTNSIPIPEGIIGKNITQKRNNYSKFILNQLERLYPTQSLLAKMDREAKSRYNKLLAFTAKNPEFSFDSDNINEFNLTEEQHKIASAVQRLFKITPTLNKFKTLNTMYSKGLTSSAKVSRIPRSKFVKQFASQLDGEDIANQVYNKARHQHAKAMTIAAQYKDIQSTSMVSALKSKSEVGIPDLETLFGSTDYCHCEHCQSVLSPGAYFVDLLHWLEDRDAISKLLNRRKDLENLKINCENSHTVLPYIDLVNEILENLVASNSNRPTKEHNITDRSSDDLLVQPQYENEHAYKELKESTFPLGMPFDYWHKQSEVCLEHLGIRKFELMEIFQSGANPSNTDISNEIVLPNNKQYSNLLEDGNFAEWYAWNLEEKVELSEETVPYLNYIASVPVFLKRASIDFENLLDMAHFYNLIGIENSAPGQCSLNSMTIVTLDKNQLNAEVLREVREFLRIFKANDWTVRDLAELKLSINKSYPISELIDELASAKRIQLDFGVDAKDLPSLWNNLSTRQDRPEKETQDNCIYDQVFLHNSFGKPEDSLFKLNHNRKEINSSNLNLPLVDIQAELSAALQLDSTEVLALITYFANQKSIDINQFGLKLSNLSLMYRATILSRATGLSIEELLLAARLLKTNLGQLAGPKTALRLLQKLESIAKSPFSVGEICSLLSSQYSPGYSEIISEHNLELLVDELRSGLQLIFDQSTEKPDPNGESTRKLLTEFIPESLIEPVMEILDRKSNLSFAEQLNILDESLYELLPDFKVKLLEATAPDDGGQLQGSQRYEYVYSALFEQQQTMKARNFVVERLAQELGVTLESAQIILEAKSSSNDEEDFKDFLQDSFVYPTETVDSTESMKQYLLFLHKISLIFKRLNLSHDEQVWYFENSLNVNSIDLFELIEADENPALLYEEFLKLVQLVSVRDELPGQDLSLIQIFDPLNTSSENHLNINDYLEYISTYTGWNQEDLQYLVQEFGIDDPDSLLIVENWQKLLSCFTYITKCGASAKTVLSWRDEDASPALAESVKQVIQSRYTKDTWKKIGAELRHRLRSEQNRALIDWLVGNSKGIDSSEDLFDQLLIDVDMSDCQMTTRIKLAISSIQLFIQRCFLNLESGIQLSDEDARSWKWMKNYRVWEAARKVFLYPENWIEPELRDNKSQFYKDFENQMQQNEVTHEASENATLEYLDKLLEVSRLEPAGIYHEKNSDEFGDTDILHVFARSQTMPHQYWYCTLKDKSVWSPFEKVDLEVDEKQVLPVVHNRRLFLFWPTFQEKAVEGTEGEHWNRYWEVRLSYSEYRNGKWMPKRMSDHTISTQHGEARYLNKESFNLKSKTSGKELVVDLFNSVTIGFGTAQQQQINVVSYFRGSWKLDLCSNALIEGRELFGIEYLAPFNFKPEATSFKPIFNSGSVFVTAGRMDEHGVIIGDINQQVELFDTLPKGTSIVTSHQYNNFLSQSPFYINNEDRVFFVEPRVYARPKNYYFEEADAIDPSTLEILFEGDMYEVEDTIIPEIVDLSELEAIFPEGDIDRLGSYTGLGSGDFARSSISSASAPQPTSISAEATMVSAPMVTATMTYGNSPIIDMIRDAYQVIESAEIVKKNPIDMETTGKYHMSTFYHPFICPMIEQSKRYGIGGLLSPDEAGSMPKLSRQRMKRTQYFDSIYKPTSRVDSDYPVEEFDFNNKSPYSHYNWELFFHLPFAVATMLNKNQKFEEAMDWFHYIFDPLNQNQNYDVPQRYWKVRPLINIKSNSISNLLLLLSASNNGDEQEGQDLELEISEWSKDPFNPHLLARIRPIAYQKAIVMKYLDNLLDWGDYLFRQDSIESINEATQLYILALKLLGKRPVEIRKVEKKASRSWKELSQGHLDDFSNALEDLLVSSDTNYETHSDTNIPNVFSSLYFCVPHNPKLIEYWDKVEDRLFKIRNCMNIEGVVRQLPLFQPPIDPALLVRARAAGLDLSTVLADANQPLPIYKFRTMIQSAKALANTVRGLSTNLLSTMEKRDAEELARLRNTQEITLLKSVKNIKQLQISESKDQLAALRLSKKQAEQKHDFYAKRAEKKLSGKEKAQMRMQDAAVAMQVRQSLGYMLSGLLKGIPRTGIGIAAHVAFGGEDMGDVNNSIVAATNSLIQLSNFIATQQATSAQFDRRLEDWNFQKGQASNEIKQLDKQITASEIRLAMAEKDLANHELQIEQSQSIKQWMFDKFTNEELYDWMVSQLSAIHFQSYQLAYDFAKQAERCYQYELADYDAQFVQFGHWNSLRKGLLASDRLLHDIERMEVAYIDNNKREFELTKHVSISKLSPESLIALKERGECSVSIPEEIFDLDYPGQYLRRIKRVSVTVPCITGPYTTLNCKLTLKKSKVRVKPEIGDQEELFHFDLGQIDSISTSTGRNDSGLFQFNQQDDRYFPFERSGVISEWSLELPDQFRQFDYDTISDVIFHIDYTARDGGTTFRADVDANLKSSINQMIVDLESNKTGLFQMVSVKQNFPNDWHRFFYPEVQSADQSLALNLEGRHFPYVFREKTIKIKKVSLVAITKDRLLGSHLNSKVMNFSEFTSSNPEPTFSIIDSEFAGLPFITWPVGGSQGISPGSWTLTMEQEQIDSINSSILSEVEGSGGTVNRLNQEAFDDFVLVCEYVLQ